MESSGKGKAKAKAKTVVTTYEAGKAVLLKPEWQERYRVRAKEVLKLSTVDGQFTVRIVGRSGVGKGSLMNHLLKRPAAQVSHNASGSDSVQQAYVFGRFSLVDIPGYDGQHALAKNFRAKKGSNKPEGSLSLDEFVNAYKLFGDETSALIFVVNNRITPNDRHLMAMAIAARKFFCIVRTNADSVVRIADPEKRAARLDEVEQEMRDELELTKNLDIRIFKVSIPWPESKSSQNELEGADLQQLVENSQVLDFPVLSSYIGEPKGLYEELLIHGFVEEEVAAVLEPYIQVKKRRVMAEFADHAVLGALLPIVGPVLLTFTQTLTHTIRALAAAGLVEEPDKAVNEIVQDVKDVKHRKVIGKVASKEGLVAAVEETLVHIFGKTLLDIAIYDLAVISAESSLSGAIPVVGAFVSAARLSKRYDKIGALLAEKACMLHQLWIMQNITNLHELEVKI